MKGHCSYSMGGTAAKIKADMRRHRKSGGSVESDKTGDDDAKKDLADTPSKRLMPNKVYDEAEAKHAKHGGRAKKNVVGVVGARGRANGGRLPRASGGGCESNPFTTASKGTPARGRADRDGIEKMTMGKD